MIRNVVRFYGEELLASRQTPQAGGSPLIGCLRVLIQYIYSYAVYLEAVAPSFEHYAN
jgi:hypothetical protein